VSGSQLAPGRGCLSAKLPPPAPLAAAAWHPGRADGHPLPLPPPPHLGPLFWKNLIDPPSDCGCGHVRIPLGKKGRYFVELFGEICRNTDTDTQKVRHRVGPQNQDRDKAENPLHFFDFYAIKLAVICTVNPQVPGSSPGRGATEFLSDLGLCPATPAGAFAFLGSSYRKKESTFGEMILASFQINPKLNLRYVIYRTWRMSLVYDACPHVEWAFQGEVVLRTLIDEAEAKVVKLNKELASLRKKYANATKSSGVALESLRVLTRRSTEAALLSGKAAAKSLIAAKKVANALVDPIRLKLLKSVEEAEIAAGTATKSAADATKLVHEVLLTARTVTENEKDVAAIQCSMISVLIAIRSAEVATAATKLARSVTAFASSTTLAAH